MNFEVYESYLINNNLFRDKTNKKENKIRKNTNTPNVV